MVLGRTNSEPAEHVLGGFSVYAGPLLTQADPITVLQPGLLHTGRWDRVPPMPDGSKS